MSIQIRYKAPPGIAVKTVSVLASFCSYNPEKGKMHREGETWVYEAKLPAGEYYYKFLINGCLLLNDPAANCYAPRSSKEKELWSFLRVAVLGKRLFNNTQNSVTVEDYALSAMLADSGEMEFVPSGAKFVPVHSVAGASETDQTDLNGLCHKKNPPFELSLNGICIIANLRGCVNRTAANLRKNTDCFWEH